MNKPMIAALLGCLLFSANAMAEKGDWLVRVRAIDIVPEHKSDAGTGVLAGIPADAITLNDKWAPEVDFSYFLTKNVALELILTVPQQHDVRLAGVGKIGTAKHLPPTLTVQYHFLPDEKYRPYVGAGINYTRFSGVNINAAGLSFDLDNSSWGGALQAGIDIAVGPKTFVNFDVKKLWIDTDLKQAGTTVSHLNLNPWVVGVGFGWKF